MKYTDNQNRIKQASLPIILPTFGSQPAIAHLTKLEFVTNLPRSLAKISDGAPLTETFNTCWVPSPRVMRRKRDNDQWNKKSMIKKAYENNWSVRLSVEFDILLESFDSHQYGRILILL